MAVTSALPRPGVVVAHVDPNGELVLEILARHRQEHRHADVAERLDHHARHRQEDGHPVGRDQSLRDSDREPRACSLGGAEEHCARRRLRRCTVRPGKSEQRGFEVFAVSRCERGDNQTDDEDGGEPEPDLS